MKNSKFWVRLHVYTVSPAKVGYGFAHGITKFVYTWFWETIIHTAHWDNLHTEIIIACIE